MKIESCKVEATKIKTKKKDKTPLNQKKEYTVKKNTSFSFVLFFLNDLPVLPNRIFHNHVIAI